MAFQLSPGVNVSEIDLTTVVPSVATSDGAIAGLFRWGPVGQRVLVDSETKLVSLFGKPNSYNAETWFTAANFLSYSNSLYVSRAANTSGATPFATFNSTSGNNVFTVLSGSIANVVTGMYLTQTGNSAVVGAGSRVVVTAVNATAVTLSSNALATGQAILYFGNPQTSYSALALDTSAGLAYVANLADQIVKNVTDYELKKGSFDTDALYVAKYPGDIGNSLRISVCDSVSAFSSNVATSANLVFTTGLTNATANFVGGSNTLAGTFANSFSVGDQILTGNGSIGYQYMQITAISTNNSYGANTLVTITCQDPYRLHTPYSTATVQRYWEFSNLVDSVPGTSTFVTKNGNPAAVDEMHVVVVDDNGLFTGTTGTVLEVFKKLSRATDAKNPDSTDNYYVNVLNQNSAYIWWANDRTGATSANAVNIASSTNIAPLNMQLTLGADGYDEHSTNNFSTVASAYDLFKSVEDVDISLVMQGYPLGGAGSSYQLANYIIDNIVNLRKDCVAFISPDKSLTLNSYGTQSADVVTWSANVHPSTYAVMDSGYKYQYDRYNDIYRWIPLNGDIAGLCARTDATNDAWWSPAGLNRGQIKNIVKLAWNPTKAQRDILYKNGINPVISLQGQGTVLYGDHTFTQKPSAFDRINVRRLFIVLEKAISSASKYSLFEFNDAFTRAQFKNLITPYLRTIQGRRGITDFLVVCDETNNTGQVIDSNQFVGDIYIKPARSINFIQLNFVAVGTGVQFSEVVGKF